MAGIIVDIGTGDGKFAYQIAKKNPDKFIVGINPSQGSLEKISLVIGKKPAKGSLKNCLFILANIEDLPDELNNVASQVFINFPWSSLLKGIVEVDERIWSNIKRICQKGAIIDILTGYNESEAGGVGLPNFDIDYIRNWMSPRLLDKGFKLLEVRHLSKDELKNYPSSWGKKLIFGKDRNYFHARFELFR